MTDNSVDPSFYAELQDTVGDDFAAELLQTFLDEAPGMLGELHAAADANDADRFRRAAHSIKSNASTFGATVLANITRDLELTPLAEVRTRVPDVDTEFERAKSLFQGMLNG